MRPALTALLLAGAAAWVALSAARNQATGTGNDIVRLWVIGRYIDAGRDPYPFARAVLAARYGEGNPGRAKVFAVPTEIPPGWADRLLPEIGPPEATYPPPAGGLLALTIAQIPDPDAVRWLWFGLGVLSAGWIVRQLARLYPVPPGGGRPADNLLLAAAALLLFPPAHTCLVYGPVTLPVFALLLSTADPAGRRLPRGLALGLALIKPSVALPFALLPLVRREWSVLATAAGVQLLGWGWTLARTGGDPLPMLADWLAVSRYFLQGQYTVQDWLNPVADRLGPAAGPGVSLALLGVCGLALWAGRRLPPDRAVRLAAATAAFWMYHHSYDFVLLLPVLLPLAGWRPAPPAAGWAWAGLAAYAVLAVGLLEPVIRQDGPGFWAVRWAARLTVLGLYLREHVVMIRDARKR